MEIFQSTNFVDQSNSFLSGHRAKEYSWVNFLAEYRCLKNWTSTTIKSMILPHNLWKMLWETIWCKSFLSALYCSIFFATQTLMKFDFYGKWIGADCARDLADAFEINMMREILFASVEYSWIFFDEDLHQIYHYSVLYRKWNHDAFLINIYSKK